MGRGGCMRALMGVIVALILCCVLGWFAGVPWLQDQASEGLSKVVATQVSNSADGAANGGEIRFSVADLQQALQNENQGSTGLDITVDVQDGAIVITLDAQNVDSPITYRVDPSVTEDGRLNIDATTSESGVFKRIFSPDLIEKSLEGGVNQYLEEHNLTLTDVRIEGSDLVLETVPAN